jgi:hypothetical protein
VCRFFAIGFTIYVGISLFDRYRPNDAPAVFAFAAGVWAAVELFLWWFGLSMPWLWLVVRYGVKFVQLAAMTVGTIFVVVFGLRELWRHYRGQFVDRDVYACWGVWLFATLIWTLIEVAFRRFEWAAFYLDTYVLHYAFDWFVFPMWRLILILFTEVLRHVIGAAGPLGIAFGVISSFDVPPPYVCTHAPCAAMQRVPGSVRLAMLICAVAHVTGVGVVRNGWW